MKYFSLFGLSLSLVMLSVSAYSQTLYVPNGTVGTSTNSNVGIGTSSPNTKLEVIGEIRFGTGVYYGSVSRNGSSGIIEYANSQGLGHTFSGGNVGIGTTAPKTKLMITGGQGSPASSGDQNTGINIGTYGGIGLNMGVANSYTWLQSGYTDNANVTIPFSLQPIGGNVGIGTTTPTRKLEVNGILRLPDNNQIEWGGANNYIYGSNANNYLRFVSNGSERMAITSTGNVGIGTTTPQGVLHISKDVYGPKLILDDPNASNKVPIEFRSNNIIKWEFGQRPTSFDFAFWNYDGPIAGNYYPQMWFSKSTGNVGIGTTTPTSKFTIDTPGSETPGAASAFGFVMNNNDMFRFRLTDYNTTGADLALDRKVGSTWYNTLYIDRANGNVLIGKTTQTNSTYKLDINGKIRADEVVVNTTGADFVFAPDYKLPNLFEVESFIKKNNHLPEIAPASEMKGTG